MFGDPGSMPNNTWMGSACYFVDGEGHVERSGCCAGADHRCCSQLSSTLERRLHPRQPAAACGPPPATRYQLCIPQVPSSFADQACTLCMAAITLVPCHAQTLFGPTDVPSTFSGAAGSAYAYGVRSGLPCWITRSMRDEPQYLTAPTGALSAIRMNMTVSGSIRAMRFYKAAGEGGTGHTVK